MQRITIGRYTSQHVLGVENGDGVITTDCYAGWVEGVRDDGTSWVMWIDAHGSPDVFWRNRDEDGGVIGSPIVLGRDLPTLESNSTVTPAEA